MHDGPALSELCGRYVVAAVREPVIDSEPVDHGGRIPLDVPDLSIRHRAGPAPDCENCAVRLRVFDLHTLECAVMVEDEVVVPVLAEREGDLVALLPQVGGHH